MNIAHSPIRWNIQVANGSRVSISGPSKAEVDKFKSLMTKASKNFARIVKAI